MRDCLIVMERRDFERLFDVCEAVQSYGSVHAWHLCVAECGRSGRAFVTIDLMDGARPDVIWVLEIDQQCLYLPPI